MGCGCRKNKIQRTIQAATAGSSMTYEVFVNGTSTGRSFTSLVSAQQYAQQVGGEIHAK